MAEHPIQGLMKTTMESIKDMVAVNTIVGDAVETSDGTVIIPISRVAFGFAAGGGDYEPVEVENQVEGQSFGGGSGAGVSVKPVGFLVCSSQNEVRFMPVEGDIVLDRLIEMIPKAIEKIQGMIQNSPSDDQLDELAKTAETQSVKVKM